MLLISRNEALTEARERLNEYYGKRHPKYFRREHVNYRPAPDGEALAMINYTSGTTSNSKGVLLPFRALWSNCKFAQERLGDKAPTGSRIISMLPMAHMYGMASSSSLSSFKASMCTISPASPARKSSFRPSAR